MRTIRNIKNKRKLNLLSLRKKIANLEKAHGKLQKEIKIQNIIIPAISENFYQL